MKKLKEKVRNKTVSIEEEKANNDSIINSMPDRFYQVPGFHLSLKQNLHFHMRKNELNPMGSTFILPVHVSHSISYIDIDD